MCHSTVMKASRHLSPLVTGAQAGKLYVGEPGVRRRRDVRHGPVRVAGLWRCSEDGRRLQKDDAESSGKARRPERRSGMKRWFIRIGIGVLAISHVLATVAGVWAMSASPGGEPITPAFQRAGTGVRFLLGLAVAATLGVPL
jgi:CO/xanthine dehydrogenase Mo-binding subunit